MPATVPRKPAKRARATAAPPLRSVVNVHEAKTQLSRLLVRVEAGEEITIARAGKAFARLVPLALPPAANPYLAMNIGDALAAWEAREARQGEDEPDFPASWLERRGTRPDPLAGP